MKYWKNKPIELRDIFPKKRLPHKSPVTRKAKKDAKPRPKFKDRPIRTSLRKPSEKQLEKASKPNQRRARRATKQPKTSKFNKVIIIFN